MSTVAPDGRNAKPATLEEAALTFTATRKNSVILEQHRAAILNLRARGATITQIEDILSEFGVSASEWALIRFCRKYRAEWRRIQCELQQPSKATSAPVTIARASVPKPVHAEHPISPSSQQTQTPSAAQSRKQGDMSGDF